MGDGILKWFGASMVTAGLTAGMLAGAGMAVATDGTTSDTGGSTTSDSSNSPDSGQDSEVGSESEDSEESNSPDEPETVDPDVDPGAEPDVDEEEPAEEEPAEEPADEAESDDEATAKGGSDREHSGTTTDRTKPESSTTPGDSVGTETEPEKQAVVDEDEQPVTETVNPVERQTVVLDIVKDIVEAPEVQAVAFVSAPTAAVNATATAPQIPGIIRAIGTMVFNLYAVAIRLVGGPPMLPANSTVTVRSSTLRIDCACADGEGVEVPADWYIPETEEGEAPPSRLIYLQHGFLAAGPWYSHTAAALAEQTNSIVVAPSITSNFFAADACWLGASPMHEAMAGLFDDDNTALAESALAAGYAGPIPDRVVLMGHSLGGGAVSGIAGFMAEDDRIDRLAGVVLLDGVGLDDPEKMLASLKAIPDEIPIYQLAAPVYFWNNFGVGIDALVQARPDQFVGVTLVGGSHVDAMRGGNPLIQFSQQLVSGFSKRENVAAARMLMVGWVNDMFAGNQESGIYLEPGEEFSFETPAGEADVVALPNSLKKPFILNPLRPLVAMGNGIFTFESTCVAESVGATSTCQDQIAA
ncbi:MAG TPA: alpha/beta hydrolase [Mycobacterium sp.]|nr:alpha/beta hydrolase [Mycobacterium sp.]